MNRFFGVVIVVALAVGGVAGYFYVNPHHMPSFIRIPGAGLQLPTPRSPVSNFRPPQF
jgi:hypothetical protein